MMKVENKILVASILIGLSMWIIDAVVDWLFFFQGTFWQSMATMVAPHDAYLRVLIMVVFPLFGVLISKIVARMRRLEEALESSEKALRDIIDFDNMLLNTIPFGIEIVDEDRNVLFMNKTLEEYVDKDIGDRKCYELVRDDGKMCPGCPLAEDIKFGKAECLEVKRAFGGKTVRIFHTGMFYSGKEAMLEIFQNVQDYNSCRLSAEGTEQ